MYTSWHGQTGAFRGQGQTHKRLVEEKDFIAGSGSQMERPVLNCGMEECRQEKKWSGEMESGKIFTDRTGCSYNN